MLRRRWALPLILILAAGALSGQEFRGFVTGRVWDAQRAAVPSARIFAAEVQTGAKSETVSGPDGLYTLPYLAPGTYRVIVEAQGFKRYVRDGIIVGSGERIGLEIELELGPVTDSVTVTAESPLLQTASASTGQVITGRQLENMPMNGRTPLVLAQLAPGVMFTGNQTFIRPYDNNGPASMTMAGGLTNRNELLIDGAPNTAQGNSVYYNPPVDAVAEVKVDTLQFDATYGRTTGGTVNVVLKSGTNAFHGAAYEYNQVSALAANSFFANRAGRKKSVWNFNQYGFNTGGPVYVPKVFDGRNKLLFQLSYEGIKIGTPNFLTRTVPTEAERNGDFSGLLGIGSSYQMYDPLTGVREGSRIRRQAFANNVIPSNRISPIAKNILKYYPLPNQPGLANGQNNWFRIMIGELNFDNEVGRLDFLPSARHKMFFSFRRNLRGDYSNQFENQATGGWFERANWGAMLDDVHTFSPSLVLNTRLNWTRFTTRNVMAGIGFDPASLGLPAYLAAESPSLRFPRVEISGFTSLADGTANTNSPFDIFQIFASVAKVTGNHSLKLGADLRLDRTSFIDSQNSTGRYIFGNEWTRGPLDNSASAPIGQGLAALLLGLPTSGQYDLNATRMYGSGHYALSIQDDWRVRRDLTFNVGLRYERDMGTKEHRNRAVNGWDYDSPSPIDAAVSAAYDRNPIPQIPAGQFHLRGGLLFASDKNPYIYRPYAYNFGPRFGWAWKPPVLGGKNAVRGGFGMFFQGIPTEGVSQFGFSQTTGLEASRDSYLTPYATLANPFPDGIQKPLGATMGLATALGQQVRHYNPHPRNPYALRWNLNVQRELARNLLFEIGYAGNHGVHLIRGMQLSSVPRQYYTTSPFRDQATINFLEAIVPNPFAGLVPGTFLNGTTIARYRLLTAGYPQFDWTVQDSNTNGSSYFHSMVVRVEKRFSQGLQFLANYQFSRLMATLYTLNGFAFQQPNLKQPLAEDRPHHFSASASYDLPLGKGKRFAGTAGPLLDRLAGGWIVNGIFTFQSGTPSGWGNVIYYGGDVRWDPKRIDQVFDVTRFNRNPAEQLAYNIRTLHTTFSNLRTDGINNLDFSVLKDFRIREKLKLQYRCEFFNFLNHAMFSAPDYSPTSAGFGRSTDQVNSPRTTQMALRLQW